MRQVRLALGLGGLAFVALASFCAERLAGPWVWNVGLSLGQLLAPSVGEPSERADVDWDAIEREVAAADVPSGEAEGSPRKGGKKKAKGQKQSGGALFVSAERVLALSKSAQVPASRYVPASGVRPAGLQVAGVGGLGIGVKDGDVLTKVAGAEVRSSAAVISTVLKLRAQKAAAISGEFWRGQERWQIVFEMPYVAPNTPSTTPAASGTGAGQPPVPPSTSPSSQPRPSPTPSLGSKP